MGLSSYEKESILNFNEEEGTASFYTYNAAWKKRLGELCIKYPGQVRQADDNGAGGLTFELPKKWVKVSPPRVLSPAQKKVLETMNRKRRERDAGQTIDQERGIYEKETYACFQAGRADGTAGGQQCRTVEEVSGHGLPGL